MTTNRVKLSSISIVMMAFLGVLTGCQQPTHSSGSHHIRKSSTPPSYMVSVQELGSRLNMSVTTAGNPYYELKDQSNRVVLFTHENGQVVVNGQAVGRVGPVVDVNGTYYVAEILLSQIRPYLQSAQPIQPAPQPSPAPWTPRTGSGLVVIDPGHGGRDPGAISYLGHHEKDIVLQISHRVASVLQQRGIEVIMTRRDDTFIELEERAAIANRANADLFVSIHADAHNDRSHRGFTIYIANSASATSRRMGRSIENAMSRIGIPSKGLRTADYRVLVRTSGPAVLVETGYLSNPSEAALLLDGAHQQRIANAIAEGIINAL